MLIKIVALSAILACAYGGGHTHIAHSIEIKHEQPKKVDYHHQSQNSYGSSGSGISSIGHYENNNGLSLSNGHQNALHDSNQSQGHGYSSQSITFHGDNIGYHKSNEQLSLSSIQGLHHQNEEAYQGHAVSSQSINKHEVKHEKHENGKQESKFSGYHYEAPKYESSFSADTSHNRYGKENSAIDSQGHAYSSQSIIHHKTEHGQHKENSQSSNYDQLHKVNSNGLSSSGSDSGYSGYKTSYDSGLGLGHYSSSQQDTSDQHSGFYHHNSISEDKSTSDHSHGHSISIQHGHSNEIQKQEYSHQLSNSFGHLESSENKHDYKSYQNEESSVKNQVGKSHGHTISIHHEVEKKQDNAQHKSEDYYNSGKFSGLSSGSYKHENNLGSSSLSGYESDISSSGAFSGSQGSNSEKSHGHSVSIHHETGHGLSLEGYESSDSGYKSGIASVGLSSVKHDNGYDGYSHHDALSHSQSTIGKSHGHSVSIHHIAGNGYNLGGYKSESANSGYKSGSSSSETTSVNQGYGFNGHSDEESHDHLNTGKSHGHSVSIHHDIGKSYGHDGYSSQSANSGYNGFSSTGVASVSQNTNAHGYLHHESSSHMKSNAAKSHGHAISIHHDTSKGKGGYQSGYSSGSSVNQGLAYGFNSHNDQESYDHLNTEKSHGHSVSIHHDIGKNDGHGEYNSESANSGYNGFSSTGAASVSQNTNANSYLHRETSSDTKSNAAKSHGHSISIHHDTSKGKSGYQSGQSGYSSGSLLTSVFGHDSNYIHDSSSNAQEASGKLGHSLSIHHENSEDTGYSGYKSQSSSDHATSSQNLKLHNHEGYHYNAPSSSGYNFESGLSHGLSLSSGRNENGFYKETSLGSQDSTLSHGYSGSSIYHDNHEQEESERHGQNSGSSSGLSDHGEEHYYVEHHTLPKYEFHYEVKDKHTGDVKHQHELRDGHSVKGEYSLRQPDGSLRVVEYHADKHTGFKSQVQHETHHHQ